MVLDLVRVALYFREDPLIVYLSNGDDIEPYLHLENAFIQAIVYAGGNSDRWLNINRYVGLAWAIQSELKRQTSYQIIQNFLQIA